MAPDFEQIHSTGRGVIVIQLDGSLRCFVNLHFRLDSNAGRFWNDIFVSGNIWKMHEHSIEKMISTVSMVFMQSFLLDRFPHGNEGFNFI
jgi:hypothetical protein